VSSAQRTTREQAIYDSLVYPGSDVLRNRLGIADQAALDRAEADFFMVNEPTRPIFKRFTLLEMRAIHKHLLGEVYSWAGQIRTYTTGRSPIASFARPEHIESYFEMAVQKPLQRENYLKGSSREQFAERSAYFAGEVNAVHPFIDGNGRATRLFLQDLASQAGFRLSIVRLEARQGAWYEAMKETFERSDTSKLQREILNALDSPAHPG
jgi:cell filamentation protein